MTRVLALVLLASCRYHATNVENLTAECETHCSKLHQLCVQNGQAAKLGLPGITFDLCRQELEGCQRDCRPITPPVVMGTSNEAPRDGVEWNAQTRVLSCSRSSLRVTVTEEAARALTRGGADAAMINLAPDSVLLVRGGTKAFPPLLEDWAVLHAQLTGQPDAKVELQVNAKTVDGENVWAGTYDASGTRFVVRAREQPGCRWLTIEREGTERRAAAVSSW